MCYNNKIPGGENMKIIGIKADRLYIKYDNETGNIYCQYSPDSIGTAANEAEAVCFCKNKVSAFKQI